MLALALMGFVSPSALPAPAARLNLSRLAAVAALAVRRPIVGLGLMGYGVAVRLAFQRLFTAEPARGAAKFRRAA